MNKFLIVLAFIFASEAVLALPKNLRPVQQTSPALLATLRFAQKVATADRDAPSCVVDFVKVTAHEREILRRAKADQIVTDISWGDATLNENATLIVVSETRHPSGALLGIELAFKFENSNCLLVARPFHLDP